MVAAPRRLDARPAKPASAPAELSRARTALGVAAPRGDPAEAVVVVISPFDHRAAHGFEPICKVLPIAPSSYHAHVARRADPAKRSARAQPHPAARHATPLCVFRSIQMETDAGQTTSQKVQPLDVRLALGWIIPWSSRKWVLARLTLAG
jgi:hypothetical protein